MSQAERLGRTTGRKTGIRRGGRCHQRAHCFWRHLFGAGSAGSASLHVMLGVRTWFAKCSLTGPGPRRSASLRRKRWTRQSALHLSPAPGLAQPNPGSRGARLPRWKTRGVVDERRSHFGRTPLGGKTAVARQRGRRPPQILAARGRPSRWRGRWRVGSIIPCRAFPRQKPTGAELRPHRPHRPELRGAIHAHAKKRGEGAVCDPRVFCPSKIPSFLARWRVRGRPAVRGPAGTGSVGDGVGEGAKRDASVLVPARGWWRMVSRPRCRSKATTIRRRGKPNLTKQRRRSKQNVSRSHRSRPQARRRVKWRQTHRRRCKTRRRRCKTSWHKTCLDALGSALIQRAREPWHTSSVASCAIRWTR